MILIGDEPAENALGDAQVLLDDASCALLAHDGERVELDHAHPRAAPPEMQYPEKLVQFGIPFNVRSAALRRLDNGSEGRDQTYD